MAGRGRSPRVWRVTPRLTPGDREARKLGCLGRTETAPARSARLLPPDPIHNELSTIRASCGPYASLDRRIQHDISTGLRHRRWDSGPQVPISTPRIQVPVQMPYGSGRRRSGPLQPCSGQSIQGSVYARQRSVRCGGPQRIDLWSTKPASRPRQTSQPGSTRRGPSGDPAPARQAGAEAL